MEFFTAVSVISIAIVSLSGALALIFKLIRGIYRAARRIERIYDEVNPNAGSSLRDAIDRIEIRVNILEEEHARIIRSHLENFDK